MPNPAPKEDTWAFNPIGSPFSGKSCQGAGPAEHVRRALVQERKASARLRIERWWRCTGFVPVWQGGAHWKGRSGRHDSSELIF
uniref:Candidate secreted effector n=1 Tax=Meloidogyne incognita TaxID=6306 RepID=A0A914NUX4_MELIC